MKTKLPNKAHVRAALAQNWRYIRRTFSRSEFEEKGEDSACSEVRLQVWPSGDWTIHTGPSDYDQDHRGFWGASFLSYDRQNLTELAEDLIGQCAEEMAMAE